MVSQLLSGALLAITPPPSTWLRAPGLAEQLKPAKLTVDFLPPDEVQNNMAGLSKITPQYTEEVKKVLGK